MICENEITTFICSFTSVNRYALITYDVNNVPLRIIFIERTNESEFNRFLFVFLEMFKQNWYLKRQKYF